MKYMSGGNGIWRFFCAHWGLLLAIVVVGGMGVYAVFGPDFSDRTDYWPNGKASYRIERLPDGHIKETFWYESGIVQLIGFKMDGELDSTGTRWYPDGRREAEIRYHAGKESGTWRMWNRSGILEHEANYVEGELEGKSMSYYSGGALLATENYVHGKLHGERCLYDSFGRLVKIEIYINGELISPK